MDHYLSEKKTCIVTGANAGLGFETAKSFAETGGEVIMICRSREKGQKACQTIVETTGNKNIHLFIADLSDQSVIIKTASDIRSSFPRVDVLVNNAAAVVSEHTLTPDGIETQFAVNHLAGFLLTHHLMESLLSSNGARVVNVSSGNHRRGKIHFDNIHLDKDYHVLKAYNQSKLANVLFTYELDRRLKQNKIENLTVNCVDPGTNYTDIGAKVSNRWHALAWKLRRLVSMPASEGAQCQVFVASSKEVEGISGKFWYKCKAVPSAKHSYDERAAQKLWDLSKGLCDLDDYFKL